MILSGSVARGSATPTYAPALSFHVPPPALLLYSFSLLTLMTFLDFWFWAQTQYLSAAVSFISFKLQTFFPVGQFPPSLNFQYNNGCHYFFYFLAHFTPFIIKFLRLITTPCTNNGSLWLFTITTPCTNSWIATNNGPDVGCSVLHF